MANTCTSFELIESKIMYWLSRWMSDWEVIDLIEKWIRWDWEIIELIEKWLTWLRSEWEVIDLIEKWLSWIRSDLNPPRYIAIYCEWVTLSDNDLGIFGQSFCTGNERTARRRVFAAALREQSDTRIRSSSTWTVDRQTRLRSRSCWSSAGGPSRRDHPLLGAPSHSPARCSFCLFFWSFSFSNYLEINSLSI